MTQPHPQPKECYDGTPCIDGKSDACNICYIPLQCGEKVSCKLHTICRYCVNDCFNYNPDYKCDFDTRPHTPAAPAMDTLADLKITASMLYEFCEWFCDYDCEEKPCNVTVSLLHERLEGIKKQMEEHPEYLEKWNAKRIEQKTLLRGGAP